MNFLSEIVLITLQLKTDDASFAKNVSPAIPKHNFF